MKYFALVVSFFWLCKGSLAQDSSCFTNTTDLFDYLAQVADGSDDIAVVLCPDTVFSIGNIDMDSSAVEGGTMPLVAFPRVQYMCGEDGSSSNNCIFENGDIQFWNPPGAAVETVLVQGLTFRDATFASIYLQGSGQISFIDCIIRDHVNAAPVIIDNRSFRRELGDARELQQRFQNVAFEGCVFADNQQRNPPAVFTYGVVTITSDLNTLLLDSCDFSGNIYDQDFGPGTYVVRSFGAPVDVTGSSFCANSVIGFGLVQVFSYDEDLVVDNNGGSVDENLACSFLAVSDTIPEEDGQVACLPFDAEACEEESNAPSSSPSSMPTTALPSLEPTVVDTASPTRIISDTPSLSPTLMPTVRDTASPTRVISDAPSLSPTLMPTMGDTASPTRVISDTPSLSPTLVPTMGDTASPTRVTSATASPPPTPMPTGTSSPVPEPTDYPTKQPVFPPKKDSFPMKIKMSGIPSKAYSPSKTSSYGKGYFSPTSKGLSYGKGYSSYMSKTSSYGKGYFSSMSKKSPIGRSSVRPMMMKKMMMMMM